MSTTNLLEEAKELLKYNNIASLATASPLDAAPEVAIVHYWYDGICSLYFATLPNSRKMQNLTTNNKVALAIVDNVGKKELQIEGNAQIIDNQDEIATLLISIHKAVSKNSSVPIEWPILKLHPKDITIVKVTIIRFKYLNFTDKASILEGLFVDWI